MLSQAYKEFSLTPLTQAFPNTFITAAPYGDRESVTFYVGEMRLLRNPVQSCSSCWTWNTPTLAKHMLHFPIVTPPLLSFTPNTPSWVSASCTHRVPHSHKLPSSWLHSPISPHTLHAIKLLFPEIQAFPKYAPQNVLEEERGIQFLCSFSDSTYPSELAWGSGYRS